MSRWPVQMAVGFGVNPMCMEGFVTGTLIGWKRHARTMLTHAAVAASQVSNASPLRTRSALRDVR
jgi:hypothetical protein